MVPIKYILMPVLGGIIGYITNDIAIKMLFRPRKAIYIGKWRLPFTPGLIPQQKDRIARSIGNVVSAQLLNAETLRASVLSKESLSLLRTRITKFIERFSENEDTVESFVSKYTGTETFDNSAKTIKDSLEHVIVQKMTEANIGAIIIARGMQLIKERLRVGLQATLLNKEMETIVASAINDMVNSIAPGIVHAEVQKISEKILEKRLCDLYKEHQKQIPQLVDRVVALYEKVLEENMDKLVRAVDVGGIVYKKVAAFSAAELENLIFGIMKRELKAIVYLGALLGFLMGFVNLLF